MPSEVYLLGRSGEVRGGGAVSARVDEKVGRVVVPTIVRPLQNARIATGLRAAGSPMGP